MNQRDPLELVDALWAAEVPLVVIGGYAVNFHGYLRTTEDIDVIFRRDAEVEEKLCEVLRAWGAYWISDEIDPETGLELTVPLDLNYVRSHHLLMLGTSTGFVDLFDFIPGLPHLAVDDLFATAVISGQRRFASLEWLKKMKQAAGRPQDTIDLQNLP